MSKQEFEERLSKDLLAMLEVSNDFRSLLFENRNDKERLAIIREHIEEMERHALALQEDSTHPADILTQDMQ